MSLSLMLSTIVKKMHSSNNTINHTTNCIVLYPNYPKRVYFHVCFSNDLNFKHLAIHLVVGKKDVITSFVNIVQKVEI